MDRATFARFFRDPGNFRADPGGAVDFLDKAESFQYSDFFRDYLIPNRPCVLSAKFTEDWGSRRSWVRRDGKPDLEHLLREFGEALVPVAKCDVREYNSNPKELLPFKEFVGYWREYIGNGHSSSRGCLYLKDWHLSSVSVQAKHGKNIPTFPEGIHIGNGHSSSRGCLYLKDWHLSRAFPEQDVYTTPVYFSSDWLNEYWDTLAVDDFRFVYMGPKGSWTPFHADVFRSYSWSANVCGRKRWLLYPPGQEEFLRDRHGNLPFDVTAPELRDRRIYPRSQQSRAPLEILQEAGEIVFVPSGWHHQVHNLEDTISINHNWVNGCNVAVMWRFLQDELAAVQREISQWKDPVDDWHLQCQLILKSCTGIDYKEFYNFLKVIAEHRVSVLEKGLDEEEESSLSRNDPRAAISGLGMLHAVFDLKRAVKVLSSLSANEDFRSLELSSLAPPPEGLLQRLEAAIDTALL